MTRTNRTPGFMGWAMLACLLLAGALVIAAVSAAGSIVAPGVMAVLFSPLILLGLVVWLAVHAARRSGPAQSAPATPDGSATIAG